MKSVSGKMVSPPAFVMEQSRETVSRGGVLGTIPPGSQSVHLKNRERSAKNPKA
jgi:hypothetical protein